MRAVVFTSEAEASPEKFWQTITHDPGILLEAASKVWLS